jgi:hypothetical protein
MELDAVERERKELKANENNEVANEEASLVNTFPSESQEEKLDSSSEYIPT